MRLSGTHPIGCLPHAGECGFEVVGERLVSDSDDAEPVAGVERITNVNVNCVPVDDVDGDMDVFGSPDGDVLREVERFALDVRGKPLEQRVADEYFDIEGRIQRGLGSSSRLRSLRSRSTAMSGSTAAYLVGSLES